MLTAPWTGAGRYISRRYCMLPVMRAIGMNWGCRHPRSPAPPCRGPSPNSLSGSRFTAPAPDAGRSDAARLGPPIRAPSPSGSAPRRQGEPRKALPGSACAGGWGLWTVLGRASTRGWRLLKNRPAPVCVRHRCHGVFLPMGSSCFMCSSLPAFERGQGRAAGSGRPARRQSVRQFWPRCGGPRAPTSRAAA